MHETAKEAGAMFGRKGEKTIDEHGRVIYSRLVNGTPIGTAKLREMTTIFDTMCNHQCYIDRERANEDYRGGRREEPFDENLWVPEVGQEAFMYYFEGALKDSDSMVKMFKRFENDNGRLQFPEFACLILPDGFSLPNFGSLVPGDARQSTVGNFRINQAVAYLAATGLQTKDEEKDEKEKRKPDDAKKKRRIVARKEKPVDLVPPASYATDVRKLAGHDLGVWPPIRSRAAVASGDLPEPYGEHDMPAYVEPEVLTQSGYAA